MTIVPSVITGDIVAVSFGAILGALTRYQVGKVATEYIATDPMRFQKFAGWHTSLINLSGSFLLGGIAGTPTVSKSLSSTVSIPQQSSPLYNPITSTAAAKNSVSHAIKTTSSSSSSPAGSILRRFSSNRNQNFGNSPMIGGMSPRMKLLMGVGFCGAYTTFSTYSVDVVTWLSQGQTQKALSYMAVNNIGGIAAAAIGMMVMKKIFPPL